LLFSGIVITSPYISEVKGDVPSPGAPTVNGLFYGDGDVNRYLFLNEDPGRGAVYYYLDDDNGILYIAVVVNESVNDNVFGWSGKNDPDRDYVESAGWNKEHSANKLIGSDCLEFALTICNTTWTWTQDYCYDADGDKLSNESDWLSDPFGKDGGVNNPNDLPPDLKTASSLQWDLNIHADYSSAWNVTLGDTNRIDLDKNGKDSAKYWKSPADSHNKVTYVGWPTWNSTYQWEWAMVYEMSVNVTGYDGCPFTFEVPGSGAHNSPSKDGTEDIPIPPTTLMDYGDAPDSYQTLNSSDGACHYIVINNPHLGASVDAEKDGQPNSDATGDDVLDGNDDEDGIEFTTPLLLGTTATVKVTASASGYLNAWLDFNDDGDWTDAGEQIFTDEHLTAGLNTIHFSVPNGATSGTTFARFRFSSAGGLS